MPKKAEIKRVGIMVSGNPDAKPTVLPNPGEHEDKLKARRARTGASMVNWKPDDEEDEAADRAAEEAMIAAIAARRRDA
jgi:hypothetical protein